MLKGKKFIIAIVTIIVLGTLYALNIPKHHVEPTVNIISESPLSADSDSVANLQDEPDKENITEISAKESVETQNTETGNSIRTELPQFSGEPYIEINNNQPNFSEESKTTESYEWYSELDELGRCGIVEANIGTDLMPIEERGAIGHIKPTGWHTIKYDHVDGKYLYNRCHLIAYQLTSENDSELNLITGTRYLNVMGMLPIENKVAEYIKRTSNHVLYRATPIFEGDNLLASGVQIEGLSVEDNGEGICFNVYVFNVQPGIDINYATGDSSEL